ncbi:hypothetical protein HD806DRAFT_518531 [Xylariaceae sp. AK1471]|nr:hypothetical protein HD806DRAFT_518531 [Xylariaceae sp. AK1471]
MPSKPWSRGPWTRFPKALQSIPTVGFGITDTFPPTSQNLFTKLGKHYKDNGLGRGYTLFDETGQEIETGGLRIYDKIDGETDVIFGGEIPKGWANCPHDPRWGIKKKQAYSHTKMGLRMSLPGNPHFWYLKDHKYDDYILVAGPSAFRRTIKALAQHAYRLPFENGEMPSNYWVVLDQATVRNAYAAQILPEGKFFLWTNAIPSVTFPMFHIAPDNCYAWSLAEH